MNKTRRIEAIFSNVQRTKCGNASWDVVTCRLNNDSDGDHVANGLTLFQFPTLRQWADFGFFEGFAVQAVAEEAAQQRFFQVARVAHDGVLNLHRLLNLPQYRRDFFLLRSQRLRDFNARKDACVNTTFEIAVLAAVY